MLECTKNILSIAEIRAVENTVFEIIDPYELMKKAGKQAYEIIKSEYEVKKLLIFCGSGNNAGDGYVIAKLAILDGYEVICVELAENESEIASRAKSEVDKVINWQDFLGQKDELLQGSIIIDAIFGIGFSKEVKGVFFDAIDLINQQENQIVAIDAPSGLNLDDGEICNIAVKAGLTISFIAAKPGLYFKYGKDYTGKVVIADLDISEQLVSEHQQSNYNLINIDNLEEQLPQRVEYSNKGSYGNILLLGGLDHMPGAILVASEACFRMGAGKVTIMTDSKIFLAIMNKFPEMMLKDINEEVSYDDYDLVAIGPGLGVNEKTLNLLNKVLKSKVKKVIDADALNLIAKYNLSLSGDNILTPHPKEAARLLDISLDEVESDRKQALEQISDKYKVTVILKGHASLIKKYEDKNIYVNPYGNNALAKGGSGDLLTGIAAALYANIDDSLEAAILAVAVQGKLADKLSKTQTKRSVLPSDLLKAIR